MKKNRRTFISKILAIICAICMLPVLSPEANAINQSSAISIGIDVSRYQKDIDWNAVKNSGISFAFIRVGSVKYGEDAKFKQNMLGANAAGIRTGVYIYSYATTPEQAANEAYFVLQHIAPYTVSFPVAIDIEDNAHKTLSPAQIAEIANTFCAIIEEAGYYPIVYGSKSWYTSKIGPIAYDKWVAQYYHECRIEDASIWQASSTALINGIPTNVDLDYQFKDYSKSIIPYGFVNRKGNLYFYENYKMKRNSLIPYNGNVYYVNASGKMVTGFQPIGDGIYYFNELGAMQLGLQSLGGHIYYFGEDGKTRFGLTQIAGNTYYFDPNGWMYMGWLTADHLYYFYEDGHMATGLSSIGNNVYFFDTNGYLQIGWIKLGADKFYFNPNGGMMTFGWINDGTGIYYTDATGKMVTGLYPVGDSLYYFGADGKLLTGLQQIGAGIYYFNPENGKMMTGFVAVGNKICYFDPATGMMAHGLVSDGTYIYYMDLNDGHLLVNTQIVAGTTIFVIDEFGHVTVVQ